MKNKDMLFDENLLIEIFIKADDLCKEIESEVFSKILEDKTIYGGYQNPCCKMSESENNAPSDLLPLLRIQMF